MSDRPLQAADSRSLPVPLTDSLIVDAPPPPRHLACLCVNSTSIAEE